MLIQFRIENYKSFDKEQKLSMVAGASRNNNGHTYETEKTKVLKTAAIFGSNASGKSNLIRAMRAVQNLLVFGKPIPPQDYCRIKEINRERASSFEFTIGIGNNKYVYGLEILLATGKIENEWLIDISEGGKGKKVFIRNKDISTDLKLGEEKKYFEVYKSEAINNNRVPFLLILSKVPKITKNSLDAVHKILLWFNNSLRIISAGAPTNFKFTNRRDAFTKLVLPAYGTGISDIAYQKLDSNNNPIPFNIINDITRNINQYNASQDQPLGVIDSGYGKFPVFAGKNNDVIIKKMMFDHDGSQYEYYEESDGTKRLYDLTPILDPEDEKELVYVIDELDRSLHPQLTKKFVKDFGKLNNALKRQLIITTHESRLMDLNLLRRDEIWFIEKKNGASSLYSLEEFNERTDRRIDKAYLNGRYGATPCFKEIFPDLE